MKTLARIFNAAGLKSFGRTGRATSNPAKAISGNAGSMMPLMENLEQRQYLFDLVVGGNVGTFTADPNRPGFGTQTVVFGYFIPFFAYAAGLPTIAQVDPPAVATPPAPPNFDPRGAGPVARNRMAQVLERRLFGATIQLYGAVDDPATVANEGTTLQVRDLYNRVMAPFLALGRPVLPESEDEPDLNGDAYEANADWGTSGALGIADFDPITRRDQIDARNNNRPQYDWAPYANARTDARQGDGVPEFNDGIGTLNLVNSNRLTRVIISGGTITRTDLDADPNEFDYWEQVGGEATGYGFNFADTPNGLGGAFQAVGFGYYLQPGQQQLTVRGLAGNFGNVIIGQPFANRDNTDPGAYYGAPGFNPNAPVEDATVPSVFPQQLDFTSTTRFATIGTFDAGGAVVPGVNAVRSVSIYGGLHGSLRVTGMLGEFNSPQLLGSLNVDGDVNDIIIGGVSGAWFREENLGSATALDQADVTGSQVNVGGALGRYMVAGRSFANVVVLGDTATDRSRIDFTQHTEREVVYGVVDAGGDLEPGRIRAMANAFALAGPGNVQLDGLNGGVAGGAQGWLDSLAPAAATGDGGALGLFGYQRSWGNGYFRNETIANAEFVSSGTRGAVIRGRFGFINELTGEADIGDTYAFAAERGRRVQLSINFQQATNNSFYARVVDGQGRILATHQNAASSPRQQSAPGAGFDAAPTISFEAPATGVYYILIGGVDDGNPTSGSEYEITLLGQAAMTLGQYLTGGGGRGSFLSVRGGAVGQVSFGRGLSFDTQGGQRAYDRVGIGTADYLDSFGFTMDIRGSMYSFITGASMGVFQGAAPSITVARDLGEFIVGTPGFLGGGGIEGNLTGLTLTTGTTIGRLQVNGAIGYEFAPLLRLGQTVGPNGTPVAVTSGVAGEGGSIGAVIVERVVYSGTLRLVTPSNSTVDLIDVRGAGEADLGGGFQLAQPVITTGQNSDVRFARFAASQVSNPGQSPTSLEYNIGFGQTLTLVDDSGAQFTISMTGNSRSVGIADSTVRVVAVSVGVGVVVGLIEANLFGGADLVIRTTAAGTVGIGDIRVVSNGFGLPVNNRPDFSNVSFLGNWEIDVAQMFTAGLSIGRVANETPDGDILSGDLGSVVDVFARGSIGVTRVAVADLRALAFDRPVIVGEVAAIGGAIGVDERFLASERTGTFIPAVWTELGDPTLEDGGAPFDQFINGLIIRTGNVNSVVANGSVGDVILQGGADVAVLRVTANADGDRRAGVFQGITGSIYSGGGIGTVDVGDGLRSAGETPFAEAGIFGDVIQRVQATRIAGATINGPIVGATVIGTIALTNASILNTVVASGNFDSFWISTRFAGTGLEANGRTGLIDEITITNGSIVGTQIFGNAMGDLRITRGVLDAVNIDITTNINSITADAIRNTLTTRPAIRFQGSNINVGQNLNRLTLNNVAGLGYVSDTIINVNGSVQALNATELLRSDISILGTLVSASILNSVRNTELSGSALRTLTVRNSLIDSSLKYTGPITTVNVTNNISNTLINSSGPDGRITSITAGNTLTGSILSSGPIQTITASRGDIIADISTTTADAPVGTIRAGRDIILRGVIGGSVTTIQAGRNIGRLVGADEQRTFIDIGGNLGTISASGPMYSDLRVSGTINSVTMGRAVSYLPGNDLATQALITSSGRINSVSINGDFDGSIVSYSGGIGSVTITNGSFRPGTALNRNRIEAQAGDIGTLTINRGHLLGDVIAQTGSINAIRVTGDTVFGSIGRDPNLSPSVATGVAAAERRNQLPTDSAPTGIVDGPIIRAGRDITSITVAGGIYESIIQAGRNIGTISVTRGIDDGPVTPQPDSQGISTIAAGDSINSITVGRDARLTNILSGLVSFGADGRAGGTGANADVVRSGTINTVTFRQGTDRVVIGAGLVAGTDGIYGTADDQVAVGISTITNVTVTGAAVNTQVRTDAGNTRTSTNLRAGSNSVVDGVTGTPLAVASGLAFTGANGAVSIVGGTGTIIDLDGNNATTNDIIRVVYTGPAGSTATYDPVARRIILSGTTTASVLRVTGANSSTIDVGNLIVQGRDDASLGTLDIQLNLTNSFVLIDGSVTTLTTRNLAGSPVRIGQAVTNATFGSTAAVTTTLQLEARSFGTVRVLNTVVNGGTTSFISALDGGTVNIAGDLSGRVTVGRDLTSVIVTGSMLTNSVISAGGNLGTVTVASMNNGLIAAGGNINSVSVVGNNPRLIAANMNASTIVAGLNLGSDGLLGGAGTAADVLQAGNINTVRVTGNFVGSNISAGVSRGTDNLFGTDDDRVAAGRSVLGTVTINGTATGSNLNSDSFRFISSGSITRITVGGRPFTFNGNLTTATRQVDATPLQVLSITTRELGGVYTSRIQFSQSINPDTLSGALSISEIRGGEPIAVSLGLTEGTDYTVTWDAVNRQAVIRFSAQVTSRNLNAGALPAQAGPGLFRFVLNASVLRGDSDLVRLDGDGDGQAATDDNYSADSVVGDAGDRFTPSVGTDTNNPPNNIDFYSPLNLDVLTNPNSNPLPNAPQTNRPITVSGSLGDHPDHNPTGFGLGSDVDIYSITLQVGQILRVDPLVGAASGAQVFITDANGLVATAAGLGRGLGVGGGSEYFLAGVAGTYFIVVTSDPRQAGTPGAPGQNAFVSADPTAFSPLLGNAVVNLPAIAGAVGDYQLTLSVLDDFDSSFASATTVQNAPLPSDFVGTDGTLGTSDDVVSIVRGNISYRLEPGANNRLDGNGLSNRASDDRVVGTRADGSTFARTAGRDGVFSDAATNDDVFSIVSSIGDPRPIGADIADQRDVDVYALNNGQPVVQGNRFRFTLRLSDSGSNLGLNSAQPVRGIANQRGVDGALTPGFVQFGLFDVTNAAGIDDGLLVASPPNAVAFQGTPNTIVATDGVITNTRTGQVVTGARTTYGYDAQGNLYMELVMPGSLDNPVNNGRFALVVQGTNNSNYAVDIVNLGTATDLPTAPRQQNVVLEFNGGTLDWLEPYVQTQLGQFSGPTTSAIFGLNGQAPRDYIIARILANLNAAITALGLQNSVIVSTSPGTFGGQNFSTVYITDSAPPALFGGEFSRVQAFDAFNANQNDQAVVFTSTLLPQGFFPNQGGLDGYADQVSAEVLARVGNLLGIQPIAGNAQNTGNTQEFLDSQNADSNFFIGQQNGLLLLRRIFNLA